jgi:hypothetical protein
MCEVDDTDDLLASATKRIEDHHGGSVVDGDGIVRVPARTAVDLVSGTVVVQHVDRRVHRSRNGKSWQFAMRRRFCLTGI